MNTTISLLDRLKRETALKSDYAIAQTTTPPRPYRHAGALIDRA